jgi:hypothetical protein
MTVDLRYILHIGRHKSGTSSLQHFLDLNQVGLRERGFLYAKAGRGKHIAHHALAHAFARPRAQAGGLRTPPASLEDFHHDLAQETKGWTGTVVLSSEAFQNVAPAPLTHLFPPERTQVVVYLREQADYLVSAYQQRVQATQFSGTLLDHMEEFGAADYARFLKRWTEAFGKSRLIVARYDRAQLKDGDIIHDFCHRTGVPLLASPPKEDRNPSIGGALLEIKRISNALNLNTQHMGQVYNTYSQVALKDKRFRLKSVLPEPMLNKLRQSATASNAEVSARFFQGEPLFKLKPTVATADAAIPASELCRAIYGILAHNAKYGAAFLDILLRSSLTDSQDLDTVVKRISGRLAAGEVPPRLVQALKKLQHPNTATPWAWNSPIVWAA